MGTETKEASFLGAVSGCDGPPGAVFARKPIRRHGGFARGLGHNNQISCFMSRTTKNGDPVGRIKFENGNMYTIIIT